LLRSFFILFLSSTTSLGSQFLKLLVPDRAELVAMIAEFEDVPTTAVTVQVVDTEQESPHVLYTLVGMPQPPPVEQLPVQYKVLVHPPFQPWRWILGGRSGTKLPAPGVAASFGLTSASGDTSTEINTVIYGLAIPEAAEIVVTVRGETYVRDLRETSGYLILLPDQGISPGDIEELRIIDDQGNALLAPQHVS
jgi:hypothetical protein